MVLPVVHIGRYLWRVERVDLFLDVAVAVIDSLDGAGLTGPVTVGFRGTFVVDDVSIAGHVSFAVGDLEQVAVGIEHVGGRMPQRVAGHINHARGEVRIGPGVGRRATAASDIAAGSYLGGHVSGEVVCRCRLVT